MRLNFSHIQSVYNQLQTETICYKIVLYSYKENGDNGSSNQETPDLPITGEQKMKKSIAGINTKIEHTPEFKAALKGRQVAAKVARLANLKGKSFAFRLSAILAADARPGKVWA